MKMSTKKSKQPIPDLIISSDKPDDYIAPKHSTITVYPEPVTNQMFPTPLIFAKLPRKYTDDEVAFVQRCSTNVTVNVGNTTSKDRYVLNEPVMANIRDFLQFHINYYMQHIVAPYNPVDVYITQSWLNFTKPKEYHHKHEHPNSFISGVLYINADPDKDKIHFYKNKYQQIQIPTSSFNQFNSESWWFGVGTCDLVLFPSYLSHMVEQTESAEPRISLSFNTFLKGFVGDEPTLTSLHLGEPVDTSKHRIIATGKTKEGRGSVKK
jgi:uncharacterized protein (TIGR02466 family)